MNKHKRLYDEYRYAGFTPAVTVKGLFGDPKARILVLKRRQKKRYAPFAVDRTEAFTTTKYVAFGILVVATHECIWKWRFDASCVDTARA